MKLMKTIVKLQSAFIVTLGISILGMFFSLFESTTQLTTTMMVYIALCVASLLLIAISEICEHEVYEFEYFQTCQQSINVIKLNGSLNSHEKGKELLKEYIRANTYDPNDSLHVLSFEKKEISAFFSKNNLSLKDYIDEVTIPEYDF